MKILYLVSGIGPPAGWGTEFIQNLIFALSQNDIQATIINPIYKHTPPNWKRWSKEQQKKYRVRIISLDTPNWIKQHLMIHFFLTPFLVTWQVYKLLQKERFNLIHEFSSTPIILLRAFLFKLFFRIPTVFTLSVYNTSILGSFFWIKLFDFAEYYLIPSCLMIKQIINLGIQSKKLILSPPGIDLIRFSHLRSKNLSRQKLNLPQDKFILTFFGSLTKEKGVKDIIQAIQIIPQQLQNKILVVFFVIWKGSSEHQQIKKEIKHLNLSCVLLEEKYVDIPSVLAASDVILLPQQSGFGVTIPPISVIEALAANKKIILTDIPVNQDFKNCKNCLFVPPQNAIKLAQAIEFLLQHHSYILDSCTHCKKILKHYDINKSIKFHLAVYKKISKSLK